MPGGGELGPDLVGAPGDELAAHQGEPVPDGQGLVQCDGRLGPRPGTAAHGDLFFCLIFQNVALQPAGGARESSVDYAEVVFFQLTVPDLLVHHPKSLRRFGGDDDAPGVPVDTVAQGGGKGPLLVGGPLLFLVEVGLDVGDERVDPLRLVGVDHQAGALVH